MLTGRERLEKRIKNLVAGYGPDNQLVKDYKAQLAAMGPPSASSPDRWVGAGTSPSQIDNLEAAMGCALEAVNEHVTVRHLLGK